MSDVFVRELGRVAFHPTWQEMRELAAAVRRGDSPGEVWLLEHDPVYTAGRATPTADRRDEIVEIERGGQITYHGPGQLVVYPIMPLPEQDAGAWLRRLERFAVAVCAAFGLDAEPSVAGTGVFVAGRKVASIGVAIRGWVNLHGVAINVDMDLTPFGSVRPCGLDPEIMTDLSRATGRVVAMADAVGAARAALGELGQALEPGIR